MTTSPRPRSFARDLASFYTSDVFNALSWLIVTPLLLRALGTERFGLTSVADSIFGYLSLLSLGIAPALTRYIAAAKAKGEIDALNHLLTTAAGLLGLVGGLGLLVALALAQFSGAWFHVDAVLIPAWTLYLSLRGVEFLLGQSLSAFAATNYGAGNTAAMNHIRGLGGLMDVIAAGLVIGLDLGLAGLALSMMAIAVITGWLNWRVLKASMPGLRFRFGAIDPKAAGQLYGYSVYFAIDAIVVMIAFRTDELVIGAAIGATSVAGYALAGKTSRAIMDAGARISSALYPTYAALHAEEKLDELREIFTRAMEATLYVAAGLGTIFALFGPPLLRLWLGLKPAELPDHVVLCLGLIIFTAAPISVASRYIAAVGLMPKVVLISIAEASANLGLSLLLVKPLGVTGVALGTVLAQACTTTWFNPRLALTHMGVPPLPFALGRAWRTALVTAPTLVVGGLLLYVAPSPDLGTVVGKAVVGGKLVVTAGLHAGVAWMAWKRGV